MPSDSGRHHFHHQQPSSSIQDSSGRRKRESRAGTRSVSTLSAAQLERKRANDREAQRTIRQRNREHIESLEKQVSDLTAKKEQLDNALQHNAVLEVEIDRLKRQLATFQQQWRYGDVVSGSVGTSSNYVASSSSSSSRQLTAAQPSPMMSTSSYSPTSPTSTSHPQSSSFHSSNMAGSFNPAWQPYVLTPNSSGNDGFSASGLSQSYGTSMSQYPNTSSGMVYHDGYSQSQYPNASHGHQGSSYRPRHPPYAHPVLGRG